MKAPMHCSPCPAPIYRHQRSRAVIRPFVHPSLARSWSTLPPAEQPAIANRLKAIRPLVQRSLREAEVPKCQRHELRSSNIVLVLRVRVIRFSYLWLTKITERRSLIDYSAKFYMLIEFTTLADNVFVFDAVHIGERINITSSSSYILYYKVERRNSIQTLKS